MLKPLRSLLVSEYQYYEFLAVDRPLDDSQMNEAVSEKQSRSEAFEQRCQRLRRQHLGKSSLLERLDRAGLGPTPGRYSHGST